MSDTLLVVPTLEVEFFEIRYLNGSTRAGFAISDDPDRGSEEVYDEWWTLEDLVERFPTREDFEAYVRTETGSGALLRAGARLKLRGDLWAGEALRRKVESLGWSEGDLDALVHEGKAAEAADINNAGLRAQCGYLARIGVKVEAN